MSKKIRLKAEAEATVQFLNWLLQSSESTEALRQPCRYQWLCGYAYAIIPLANGPGMVESDQLHSIFDLD